MAQAQLPAGLLAFLGGGGAPQAQAPALPDASIWAKMGANRRKEKAAQESQAQAQAAEMERLKRVWGDYQTDDPIMQQAQKIALSGNPEIAHKMMQSGYEQGIKPARALSKYEFATQNPGQYNDILAMEGRHKKPLVTVNNAGNKLRSIDDQVELDDRLARAKSDREYITELTNNDDSTRVSLNRVNKTLQLMDNPDVYTGIFADQVLDAKKFGNLMGGEFKGVAGTEALRQKMGDFVMARVKETKGAVSEKEMQLFKEYSANMENTPTANKMILGYTQEKLKRDQEMSELAYSLREAGVRDSTIRTKLKEYRNKNPLAIEKEAAQWRGGIPGERSRGGGGSGTINPRDGSKAGLPPPPEGWSWK